MRDIALILDDITGSDMETGQRASRELRAILADYGERLMEGLRRSTDRYFYWERVSGMGWLIAPAAQAELANENGDGDLRFWCALLLAEVNPQLAQRTLASFLPSRDHGCLAARALARIQAKDAAPVGI